MAIFAWGDGQEYADLPEALAGGASFGLTLAEDYYFPGYANTGGSLEYTLTSTITIPAFNTSALTYKVKIYGTVGAVSGGQITVNINAGGGGNSITVGSVVGAVFENLKILGTNNYCINAPADFLIKNCYISSIANIAIYIGTRSTAIGCIAHGKRIGLLTTNDCFIAGCILYGEDVLGIDYAIDGLTVSNCFVYGEHATDAGRGSSFYNSVLVGKTYALSRSLFGVEISVNLYNCILYSEANPASISTDGDISAAFNGYTEHLFNTVIADPKWLKTGDILEFFTPTSDSPIRTENQSFSINPLYATNLDKISQGAWSDATTPDFPDVGNVTTDDTVNNIPGTCVLPAEADTKLSVGYGADGTEFVGAYDPLGAPPVKPGLSVVSAGDGQVTLAYTLAVETDTVYARYRTFPSGSWSAEDVLISRVGSGNITVTGLTNMQNYEFSGYANAGGCDSDWADPVLKVPTDGADIYPLSEDLKDLLVNAGIGTFATVTDWQIFINTEETGPDNCITVYDTGSEVVDRVLSNGKITDKLSAQINLRSIVYQAGINKITAIQTLFENINGFTGINRDYRSIKRQQNFNYVGTDENQRFMFTLNFVVTVDDS